MARSVQRQVLPIPDRAANVAATYDAKDPDTVVPADRAAAATRGCAERADRADRRLRVRGVERVRWPGADADVRAARGAGAALHPVPHHGAVLADAGGAALGSQPPQRGHGRHHRDRDLGARLQLAAAQRLRAARGDAQAQRLLAPRSSASATRCRSGRPVRWGRSTTGPAAAAGSSTSTASSAARPTSTRRRSTRTDARGARPDSGGGLPPDRGHDRPRDRVGAPAEGADAGQAVLRLLRAGCHPRAAPRRRPSGRTSTAASSTRAGTRCARRPSPGRRSSAWCRSRPS